MRGNVCFEGIQGLLYDLWCLDGITPVEKARLDMMSKKSRFSFSEMREIQQMYVKKIGPLLARV